MVNYSDYLNYKTPYAKRFGVKESGRDENFVFADDGKSGFTPTKSEGICPAAAIEVDRDEAIERAQRKFLWGFCARELVELGAYPDPNLTLSTLNNGIHPIYQRHKWESMLRPVRSKAFLPVVAQGEAYSFGNVSTGYWLAENQIVWDILAPILRIASRILDDTLTVPVLDTLLCGNYSTLPPHLDPRPPGNAKDHDGPMYIATARAPHHQGDGAMKVRKQVAMQLAAQKLRLKIGSGFLNHDNVTQNSEGGFCHGMCSRVGVSWDPPVSVDLMIALESLQPLLRNDLNPSERLLEQFLNAITLVHETMHAIIQSLSQSDHNQPWLSHTEPFFHNHIFSEAGFALEVELLNGSISAKPSHYDGRGHLCTFVNTHPSLVLSMSGPQVIKGGAGNIPDTTTFQPIPARYFFNINDNVYWDFAVKKWGTDMLKPQAGPHSSFDYFKGVALHSSALKVRALNWETDIARQSGGSLEVLVRQSPEERAAWKVALEMDRDRRETLRRLHYRSGRVTRVLKWRKLIKSLSSKDENEESSLEEKQVWDHVIFAIADIEDEAESQAQEIIMFKLASLPTDEVDEPYDSEWLAYLHRINREMRTFHAEIETFIRTATAVEQRVIDRSNRIITILLASFRILTASRPNLQPYKSQPWRTILQTAITSITLDPPTAAQEASAHDTLHHNPRAHLQFITSLLAEARTALLAGNQQDCMRLGLEIFQNFAWDHFMRAVGGIMVCRGYAGEGRDAWIEGMEMVCEEALSESETPEEEDRMWWAGWVIEEKERVQRGMNGGAGRGNGGGGSGCGSDTEMVGMEGGNTADGGAVNCARNGKVSGRVLLSLDDVYAMGEMKMLNGLREG